MKGGGLVVSKVVYSRRETLICAMRDLCTTGGRQICRTGKKRSCVLRQRGKGSLLSFQKMKKGSLEAEGRC